MSFIRSVTLLGVVVLVGCAAPLKQNTLVDNYIIVPGTRFIPTMLCGTTAKGDACLSMNNGKYVQSILHSDFRPWSKAFLKDPQAERASHDNRPAFVLPKDEGKALLTALIKDNAQRRAERRDNDDR